MNPVFLIVNVFVDFMKRICAVFFGTTCFIIMFKFNTFLFSNFTLIVNLINETIQNNGAIICNHEEKQYINLLNKIIHSGHLEIGRNGETYSVFGECMRFSLKDNKIPILTTKKVAWKTCLKELLWFIGGKTDNKLLKDQGVHIWDANSTREFLDSVGLEKYDVDELGPIYGYQWRNFNKPYTNKNVNENGDKGIDQLQQIIDTLRDPEKRTSRRIIMTAWNPCQLEQMALPPCHVLCQFNVHDGDQLSCALYQRSCDLPLGSPFNIASYSFLTHLLARHCGLEAYELVYFMGNCHIYKEHIETIKLQLSRIPYSFPTLKIKTFKEKIDDYQVDDFEVENYKFYPPIKMEMVA